MEKDKANERSGHLMASDYRRPRPRATPDDLQVRCRLSLIDKKYFC